MGGNPGTFLPSTLFDTTCDALFPASADEEEELAATAAEEDLATAAAADDEEEGVAVAGLEEEDGQGKAAEEEDGLKVAAAEEEEGQAMAVDLGVVGAGLGLPAGGSLCLRANGVKAFPTCITIPPGRSCCP